MITSKVSAFPRVSIVIPTRDRPKELVDLLQTVFNQSHSPLEVTIVDDSPVGSGKQVVDSLGSKFASINCTLRHVKGTGDGLPAARNLGANISKGDTVLFLDDDTLLDRNTLRALATFLRDNPFVMGVQPKIVPQTTENLKIAGFTEKFENAFYKVLMLNYQVENKLSVRRSGANVFPNSLTRVIPAQRLSGCCCCYRREIFTKFRFDTNLKRWGFMEDLDLSYRVYRKNPNSFYATPHAKVIHKRSATARLPRKMDIHMTTIYWSYVFFKDVFEGSILNLIAFLWALVGNVVTVVGWLVIRNKPKREWWALIYLLSSYAVALRNLENIKLGRLDFFNKKLNGRKSCKNVKS